MAAVIELTVDQRSVCAIPDPGIPGTPEWEAGNTRAFSVEDIAESGLSATVVAGESGIGWLTATTEHEGQTVINTLEVRVSGTNIKFGDISPSTPEPKEQPAARETRESAKE